ncbi:MAG: aldolase/citrate lyase family protein [Eubacteriales bacterium]|nr:aldolase/citrate lyase family protein [Eubacteriales bacterium]
MRVNELKKRIKAGEPVIGTFAKINDPLVAEVLALAGFDFFVLDTEHVAMDREQLTNILRAAEAFGITPIVRVRENNQVEILQNLDLGYMGVQVPNVDTPDEARALVQSVKYQPLGVRGFSPSVRACGYGSCSIPEYIEMANENTMVVSHCETKTCVENIDEILTIPGIDVIFIGPMDLSQSYGKTGFPGDPEVKGAIDTVIDKCVKSGMAVGTTAANAQAAKALIDRGVQYILLGSDQGAILGWGKNLIKQIKES